MSVVLLALLPPGRRAGSARASVPWDRVGAGWVLAQYASAPPEGGSGPALARYSLSGRLARPPGYPADGQVLYLPSGTGFVTGTSRGLKLAGNGGTLIRALPVPGTSADTCNPVRWRDSATVLAPCAPPGSAVPQLWQ